LLAFSGLPSSFFMSRIRFPHLAWGLLLYTLPVVVWGAYVRASGSGDGCGDHWPSCGGEIVPTAVEHGKTWIEYSHRASTAIYGLLALWLAIWAWRVFPKGDALRKSAAAVLLFTIIEGLIGRYLVKHELVAMNSSTERVVWMALHLANVFSLLTAATLPAWWSVNGARLQPRENSRLARMWGACLLSVIALAVTGSMSALGDTLYPSSSLMEGIRQDFARDAAMILKTRPLHPLTAVVVTAFACCTIAATVRLRPVFWVHKLALPVMCVLLGQFVFGVANLLMLAPIWAQMVHLLLANLLWIGLVVLGASAVSEEVPEATVENRNEEVSRTWPEQVPSAL
jgi:heme A synthase